MDEPTTPAGDDSGAQQSGTMLDSTPSTPPTNTGDTGDWRSGLSTEVRQEFGSYLDKYNTLDDAIKGGANASKMIGNSIRLPGEDALPDEWGKVYNKLGRPELPDGYETPEIKTYKNGAGEEIPIFQLDDEAFSVAQERFHTLGLNQKQMQGVLDMYADQRMAEMQGSYAEFEDQMMEVRQQSEQQLMQEWGDKYEVNLSIAQKTIQKFGLMDELKANGLGNSAGIAKMFYGLSKHIGEAELTGDYSQAGGGFKRHEIQS